MISSMPPEEATVAVARPRRRRLHLQAVPGARAAGPGRRRTSGPAASSTRPAPRRGRAPRWWRSSSEITDSLKPDEIYQILVRRVARGLDISQVLDRARAARTTRPAPWWRRSRTRCCATCGSTCARYPEIQRALEHRRGRAGRRTSRTDPLYQAVRAGVGGRGHRRCRPARRSRCRSSCGASRWACSSCAPPRRTRRSTSTTSQFADQVIKAAVAALEKAYDLETAVMGQEQMRQLAETDPLTGLLQPPRAEREAGAGDGAGRPVRARC